MNERSRQGCCGRFVYLDASQLFRDNGRMHLGLGLHIGMNSSGGGSPPDEDAPTLVSSVPADGTTGLESLAELVLTFSENMQKETGGPANKIYTYRYSDDEEIQQINRSNPAVSVVDNVVTIELDSELYEAGVRYYVIIGEDCFEDLAGNNYAGISDKDGLDFTMAAVVPGAPTIGTATGGDAQASVTFTPPASDGGSAITSYTVTSTPGSFTGTGASSPIVVEGLTNGTAYTFTVHATNAVGDSAESAASNEVTPEAPLAPNEIIRPNGNVNTLWSTNSYTLIDNNVVQPASGSGDFANATGADDFKKQSWSVASPLGEGSVTLLRLWVEAATATIGLELQASVKIGGVETDPQALLVTGGTFLWFSVDFSGIWNDLTNVEVSLLTPDISGFNELYVSVVYIEINP
jgi:hypothetical protein